MQISSFVRFYCVALHTEGVDRNWLGLAVRSAASVALHTEGVDRNQQQQLQLKEKIKSPSTRRAWIEI